MDIPVPSELWPTSEHLRQIRQSQVKNEAEITPMELTAQFMEFLLEFRNEDPNIAVLPLLKV